MNHFCNYLARMRIPRAAFQQCVRTWRFFGPKEVKPKPANEKVEEDKLQQERKPELRNQYQPELFDRDTLNALVRKHKVVIFMKGNPEKPLCGFSTAVCYVLHKHGIEFEAHDVLNDEKLKASIKEFSQWPTIPQVFIDGEFVGGCDILLHMHKNGDLVKQLEKAGIESKLKGVDEHFKEKL